jgi:hypothetical protein
MKPRNIFFLGLAGIIIPAFIALETTVWRIYLPLTNNNYPPLPTATHTPTSTLVPTTAPTTTPVPTGVTVTGGIIYRDSIEYIHLLGEFTNYTQDTLELLRVTANLYYPAGNLIDTSITYSALNNVPPGERTCFEVLFDPLDFWSNYDFESPHYYTDGEAVIGLALVSYSGSYDSLGYYKIIGQVRNDNPYPVEFAKVIATVYNRNNQVIGCDTGYVSADPLNPGQVSSFTILSVDRDIAEVDEYRLQLDGYPDNP